MKRHTGLIVVALIIVTALLASTVFYRVDQLKDVVLVKTFGKVTGVLRGSEHAGLHFKWPWPIQRLVRYDARTRIFEDVSTEVKTRDDLNVIVTTYCTWRITDAVKFHTAIEKVSLFEARLAKQLPSWKATVIRKYKLQALVNTDPNEMRLGEIEQRILAALGREAKRDFGVEIRSVGIRSNALPEKASQVVIGVQISAREGKADEYLAEGEAMAATIEARVAAAEEKILRFAERKAADIETKGHAAAADIYTLFKKEPELASFLTIVESLKRQLKGNTVFVLDSESSAPGIGWFRWPPAKAMKAMKAMKAGPSTTIKAPSAKYAPK